MFYSTQELSAYCILINYLIAIRGNWEDEEILERFDKYFSNPTFANRISLAIQMVTNPGDLLDISETMMAIGTHEEHYVAESIHYAVRARRAYQNRRVD